MKTILLLAKYGLLGIIQGITEPLPISSSGHLVIIEHLLGLKIEGLSFEVLMNFASLIAILILFRSEVFRIASNSLGYLTNRSDEMKNDFFLVIYLIAGTIPVGILGFLFKDSIEHIFKGLNVIGVSLILTGIALWMIRNLNGCKTEQNISMKDALVVGFSQAVALIPGISRSGATIVTSLGLGMNRETAFRFSFLLYIPVSLGGIALSFTDLFRDESFHALIVPYSLAFILSLVSSYFALQWFKEIMLKGKLGYFTVYCILAGISVLIATNT